VALLLVLVVLGFPMWLLTDVYLRQAADSLCLQLGLLGLSNSTSLPFSSASGPPKCDVSHLVDPRSALCSSASVTRCYLVTRRHNIPLPSHSTRSQRVTISTQVRLRAVCTLQGACSQHPPGPHLRPPRCCRLSVSCPCCPHSGACNGSQTADHDASP
jgi:hypothetical protein